MKNGVAQMENRSLCVPQKTIEGSRRFEKAQDVFEGSKRLWKILEE